MTGHKHDQGKFPMLAVLALDDERYLTGESYLPCLTTPPLILILIVKVLPIQQSKYGKGINVKTLSKDTKMQSVDLL